ncbi:hypothetical protein GIB67_033302 [Kingdonia uniflora]|uniref:Uncharacterized protein n=2 Tax=Kingdonia uniflora TaxID=39325 RepID=A0A7J7KY62_9MAGN|nr:hypothetical protein GIB67_033302 [Kingdonia uniflora]
MTPHEYPGLSGCRSSIRGTIPLARRAREDDLCIPAARAPGLDRNTPCSEDPGGVHSPLDLSEEEWNSMLTTNLTGSWQVSKYVCRRMRDAKIKGSIVNISSIAGLDRGQLPGGVAYSASKAGVNVLTRVMALELGAHKIRVNSISPGLFKSEITKGLMQKDWLKTVALRTVPLKTFGTSDPALTSLVRYLIHDSSGYVSGNMFIVDAGTTLPGVPIFSSL